MVEMVEATRLVLVVEALVVVGTTRLPPSYPALTIFALLELPEKWQLLALAKISFTIIIK